VCMRGLRLSEGDGGMSSFGKFCEKDDELFRVPDRGAWLRVFHPTVALVLLTLLSVLTRVVVSAETRSSPAQISSVSRVGDETLYVLFVRIERGNDMRRIRATKKGSPCEGFFGGDEVAAVYDVNIVTLTTGPRTCRLDILEISPQSDDAAGTTRGRPRLQVPSRRGGRKLAAGRRRSQLTLLQ
jgi:hypothetical protein